MGVKILQVRSAIDQARAELNRRGLSHIPVRSWWQPVLRKLGIGRAVQVGDHLKSWDVLKTASFIEQRISKDSAILDLGAYASEILCILHRLGYSRLSGVDLNPDVKMMPYARAIRYEVSDFMHTPFDNESFAVITAISVIEHGFNGQALLAEVSRLLRPGGYFIASFDYWPQKVDTTGVLLFGMDWRIFSREEVLQFVEEARAYGLTPVGDVDLQAQEAPIAYAERDYTFAWIVLQKSMGGPR